MDVDDEGYEKDRYETEERGHGRHEKRTYEVMCTLDGIGERDKWEKLTVIGLCYCERTVAGKTSEELRAFIGSRRASAAVYAGALRGHWGIENNLHWQLDVTFGEDASTICNRTSARNVALLRKFALGLLSRQPGKESMATKRYMAGLDIEYLKKVLFGS
jgi:predicted transposase YbfD/YdcC